VSSLLIATSLAATYFPSRRAARIDPITSLREE
jgi:ABC-type lipoprotein release transport system permease subunit